MTDWSVKRTDTFLNYIKKHKSNNELFDQLDKKIKRFKEDPYFGKSLSGGLKGKRSTRLVKNFRLIFSIDEKDSVVYLEAIDHRKDIYG
ncbi:MAG: type II toxin-antitoxin system RelE/ParE family toxin [Candidatus Woesearchaeota archaeon]|nr:type II toxin-antitoxin system RelE/ParE family toxin [Candidatus Woesearchaeota archaeon]MDP7457110.1 type II toxin-antitoxin system RelE/ParE family toxin [Candidatus Woesearchaeota archaeon]